MTINAYVDDTEYIAQLEDTEYNAQMDVLVGQPPLYTGDYTVTPSGSSTVLETAHLKLTDNITINPIPSNYGLITWDGSIITVS